MHETGLISEADLLFAFENIASTILTEEEFQKLKASSPNLFGSTDTTGPTSSQTSPPTSR